MGSIVAQRLQTRRQPQHDHAQIARKRQQHLAYSLSLCSRVIQQLCLGISRTGLSLHGHQLGRFDCKGSVVGAKRFGDDLQRLVQVLAGMHQVGGSLHGFRTTY